MNKLNIYGDSRINEKGSFGCDISSQRLDDLDKDAIQYVLLIHKKELNCIDLGCGEGKVGIIMSMIGANVVLIDKVNIAEKIEPIANNFNLNLKFVNKDARELQLNDSPIPIDVCYSQRFIHYLKWSESVKLISILSDKMIKGSMFFISASGLNSELGNGYRHKDKPIKKRFFNLDDKIADKHNIKEPVCLYAEDDLKNLITPAGFKAISVKTSEFGNIKGIFKKIK